MEKAKLRLRREATSWAAYAYTDTHRTEIFFGKTREEAYEKLLADHKERVLRGLPPYPAPLERR